MHRVRTLSTRRGILCTMQSVFYLVRTFVYGWRVSGEKGERPNITLEHTDFPMVAVELIHTIRTSCHITNGVVIGRQFCVHFSESLVLFGEIVVLHGEVLVGRGELCMILRETNVCIHVWSVSHNTRGIVQYCHRSCFGRALCSTVRCSWAKVSST